MSSRLIDTLIASNDRAMFIAVGKNPLHLYGPKVFACEEFSTHSLILPVCVGPIAKSLPELSNPLAAVLADWFQSRLLRYRFINYGRFRAAKLDNMGIPPELSDQARIWLVISQNYDSLRDAVAGALAAQTKTIADRGYTDLRCVIIEATLFFCHQQGVEEIFMREVAEVATVILEGRHDDQKITPKNAGMILRKLAFEPQRVTAGWKIVLTDAVRDRIHRAAVNYDVPAVRDGIARCPHCSAVSSMEKCAQSASESMNM